MGNNNNKFNFIEGVERRAPRYFTDMRVLYTEDNNEPEIPLISETHDEYIQTLDNFNDKLDDIYRYLVPAKNYVNNYDHFLNFLPFNNLINLTYNDLCAYIIQFHWIILSSEIYLY